MNIIQYLILQRKFGLTNYRAPLELIDPTEVGDNDPLALQEVNDSGAPPGTGEKFDGDILSRMVLVGIIDLYRW